VRDQKRNSEIKNKYKKKGFRTTILDLGLLCRKNPTIRLRERDKRRDQLYQRNRNPMSASGKHGEKKSPYIYGRKPRNHSSNTPPKPESGSDKSGIG
ncbi:hypothetical protein L873DRAFT_1824552, partial [Choiromyces venosus 120613-1]